MKTLSALLLSVACLALPFSAFSETIGGGDLTFSPKGASPVIFSHEKHVVVNGMKCSSCHYQVFQMQKGTYKMTMERITKGDFCGNCHNGQRAFDAKDPGSCIRCHRK